MEDHGESLIRLLQSQQAFKTSYLVSYIIGHRTEILLTDLSCFVFFFLQLGGWGLLLYWFVYIYSTRYYFLVTLLRYNMADCLPIRFSILKVWLSHIMYMYM